MLSKLFKYDMRSIKSRAIPVLLLIFLAMILIGVEFGVMSLDINVPIVSTLIALTCPLLFLGVTAGAVILVILVYMRYYNNLMTDEGYLSFTLPVTVQEHIWSKFFSAVLWFLILGAVTLAGLFGAVIIGGLIAGTTDIIPLIYSFIREVMVKAFEVVLSNNQAIAFAGVGFVLLCASGILSIFKYFFAMTISGGANKANVWKIILIVIVVNTAISTITGVLTSTVGGFILNKVPGFNYTIYMMLISIIVDAAASVALFILIKNKLQKNLNLN